MRFYCEYCNSKYTIEDERVQGRELTIRCKTCSNEIKVKLPGDPSRRPIKGAINELPPSPQEGWYFAVNGKEKGPYLLSEIKKFFSSGSLADEAYVWHAEFEDWQPVAQVNLFSAALAEGRKKAYRRQTDAFYGEIKSSHNLEANRSHHPTAKPEPRIENIDAMRKSLLSQSEQDPVAGKLKKKKKHRATDKRKTQLNLANERKTALSLSNPLSEEGMALLQKHRNSRHLLIPDHDDDLLTDLEEDSGGVFSYESNLKAKGVLGLGDEPTAVAEDDEKSVRIRHRHHSRENDKTSPPQAVQEKSTLAEKDVEEKESEKSPQKGAKTAKSDSSAELDDTQPPKSDKKLRSSDPGFEKPVATPRRTPKSSSNLWLLLLLIIVIVVGGYAAYAVMKSPEISDTDALNPDEEVAVVEEEVAPTPTEPAEPVEEVVQAPVEETPPEEPEEEPTPEYPVAANLERPRPEPEVAVPPPDDAAEGATEQALDTDEIRAATRNSITPFKRPTVAPTVIKQLTREHAMEGIKKVSQSVELCRERYVRRGGEFTTPKILLVLTVAGSGDVTDFTLEPDTLKGTEFARCMNSHRPRWKFFAFGGPPQKVHRRFIIQ